LLANSIASAQPQGPIHRAQQRGPAARARRERAVRPRTGAFTGANATRKGAFEAASGGTLFLDEIGDLPPAAQAKLLRVLEERKVTRLGASKTIEVDTRVVAATHRDLEKEVAEGGSARICSIGSTCTCCGCRRCEIGLSDVPALVDYLVAATCARFGMKSKTVAADAVEALMSYDWRRNNIRELRNVVERMIIATDGEELTRAAVLPKSAMDAGQSHAPRTTHAHVRGAEARAERHIRDSGVGAQ